jgi:hypothetical protein
MVAVHHFDSLYHFNPTLSPILYVIILHHYHVLFLLLSLSRGSVPVSLCYSCPTWLRFWPVINRDSYESAITSHSLQIHSLPFILIRSVITHVYIDMIVNISVDFDSESLRTIALYLMLFLFICITHTNSLIATVWHNRDQQQKSKQTTSAARSWSLLDHHALSYRFRSSSFHPIRHYELSLSYTVWCYDSLHYLNPTLPPILYVIILHHYHVLFLLLSLSRGSVPVSLCYSCPTWLRFWLVINRDSYESAITSHSLQIHSLPFILIRSVITHVYIDMIVNISVDFDSESLRMVVVFIRDLLRFSSVYLT